MRLNGATFNGRGINAAARVPVAMAGEAPAAALSPLLDATRIRFGDGVVPLVFAGGLAASAHRFAVIEFDVGVSAALAQTVARSGTGAAVLALDGALFFAQTRYGSGELVVGLAARGDVGVQFGEGAVVMAPLELVLAGQRARTSGGAAAVALAMPFTASAIRRPQVSAAQLVATMSAQLEPSHITGGGVRYIGMFGEAPVVFSAVDAGMNRQAHIGTLQLASMDGSLLATTRRPTLAGNAETIVRLQADFQTTRRGQGVAVHTVLASCDGAVFVRGDMPIVTAVVAELTPQLTRRIQLGEAVVGLLASGDFARKRTGEGAAVISIGLSGSGTRYRKLSGDLVIEALSFSDAVLNPDADDPAEHTFMRPAVVRVLARPFIQREFTR